MFTIRKCVPYHFNLFTHTTGLSSRSISTNGTQSTTRVNNSGRRSKVVAIKIFTKGNQSDFKEKKEAALSEADLMFKLAGFDYLSFRLV